MKMEDQKIPVPSKLSPVSTRKILKVSFVTFFINILKIFNSLTTAVFDYLWLPLNYLFCLWFPLATFDYFRLRLTIFESLTNFDYPWLLFSTSDYVCYLLLLSIFYLFWLTDLTDFFWVYLTTSDYIELPLITMDYILVLLTTFDFLLSSLTTFDCLSLCTSDYLCLLWPPLTTFVYIWLVLTTFDFLWLCYL